MAPEIFLEQDDIDGYQNLYKNMQGTGQNNTTTDDQPNNSAGGFTEEPTSGSSNLTPISRFWRRVIIM